MGFYIQEGGEAGWWWIMYSNDTIQSGPYNEREAQEECDELNGG